MSIERVAIKMSMRGIHKLLEIGVNGKIRKIKERYKEEGPCFTSGYVDMVVGKRLYRVFLPVFILLDLVLLIGGIYPGALIVSLFVAVLIFSAKHEEKRVFIIHYDDEKLNFFSTKHRFIQSIPLGVLRDSEVKSNNVILHFQGKNYCIRVKQNENLEEMKQIYQMQQCDILENNM